jgi:hypothetical protein
MITWSVELRDLGFVVVASDGRTYKGEPAMGFRKLGNVTYLASRYKAEHVAKALNEGFDLEVTT